MSTQSTNPVPLNAFQRLVRVWERVHPYNAAQVMRLRGEVDLSAVTRAWSDALTATGLGRVRVDGRTFRHETLNGELIRYPVAVLPPGQSLAEHLSAELNRPFADPAEPPFRPFVAVEGDGADGHSFGVVYQHWVADSAAIRMLMREWYGRRYGTARARAGPLRQPDAGYRDLFGPRSGRWETTQVLLSLFRRHMRYRRARKAQTFGLGDYPTAVLLRAAPDGLIDGLYDRARAEGVKLNDVFLAAAAETCHRFVPAQRRANRPDLAVGSIVDLRPHAAEAGRSGAGLTDTFGLFLGFTEVVCRSAELRDFGRLVRSIAAQNRRHRQQGIGPSSLGWMIAASTAGRLVPDHELYHFYRKETPLLGGVSNVNLNGTWAADEHPERLFEYIRVSPTGPLTPLVFTLTTLGRRLHLSMTYRAALLDEAAAGEAARVFLDRLICFGLATSGT